MNKIKYLISMCFVVVFICCMSSDLKAEETEIDTSVFEYEENEDGTIFISDYNGTDETVIIPAEIDGKTVTGIGVSSFAQCETVKHLIISEGIVDILDNGFDGTFFPCKNLETVSLPSTLKTIGNNAFHHCRRLTNIAIPSGVTSIGKWAFYGCVSLTKLIISDSVIQIGEEAFNLSYDSRIPIIYGNPDAYIKTYCDADHYIKFSCIKHPNVVIDPAVAPNCKYGGRTQGSHCTVCGTVVIEQQYIRPNGQHTWDDGVIDFMPNARRNGRKRYTCKV